MKLIQSPDGNEMCLVEALDGYEGWAVLSESISRKPEKWERWNGAAFEEDARAKKAEGNARKAKDTKALVGEIEALVARVQELEDRLANQSPL